VSVFSAAREPLEDESEYPSEYMLQVEHFPVSIEAAVSKVGSRAKPKCRLLSVIKVLSPRNSRAERQVLETTRGVLVNCLLNEGGETPERNRLQL